MKACSKNKSHELWRHCCFDTKKRRRRDVWYKQTCTKTFVVVVWHYQFSHGDSFIHLITIIFVAHHDDAPSHSTLRHTHINVHLFPLSPFPPPKKMYLNKTSSLLSPVCFCFFFYFRFLFCKNQLICLLLDGALWRIFFLKIFLPPNILEIYRFNGMRVCSPCVSVCLSVGVW